MASTKVTGCIVTYNNMRTIDDTVRSLLEFTKLPFTLYTVDNCSTDGTPAHIRKEYPDVHVIDNNCNSGFGAGHNKMLDIIDSEYHVIINPDIIIRDDVISKMVEYMDANPDIGMLSPCIRFPNGAPQILGKRNPSIPYLVASRLRGKEPGKLLREYAMLDEDLTKPLDIENASGCFMLIRTSLFKEIGGFDKRYFMYFEDSDLSREVRLRSRVLFYPDAVIYHVWGRESKRNTKLKIIHIKSMAAYFGKWGFR